MGRYVFQKRSTFYFVSIEGSRSTDQFGLSKEVLAEINKNPRYGISSGEDVYKEFLQHKSSMMSKYLRSWKLLSRPFY